MYTSIIIIAFETKFIMNNSWLSCQCILHLSEKASFKEEKKKEKLNFSSIGCPKIKLSLGYLTIMSTPDSKKYFKGPDSF